MPPPSPPPPSPPVPPKPPPSPPLADGLIYANFTATVEEVIQIGTVSLNVPLETFEARLQQVLDERIGVIVEQTNVSNDAFTGVMTIYEAEEPIVPAESRRSRSRHLQTLSPLDTSSCDSSAMRVGVNIVMESEDPSERNRFMELFDKEDLPAFISDITTDGVNAAVCAPATITSVSRETVDAPPPPPGLQPLAQPDEPLPPTVLIVAITAGVLVLIFGACVGFYYFGGRRGSDAKDAIGVVSSAFSGRSSAETQSFLGAGNGKGRDVGHFALDLEGI